MSNILNKIIVIIAIAVIIGGLSAITNGFRPKSNNPKQYKSYKFTDKDLAELTVTKFIRAIEEGNVRYAHLMLDEGSKYRESRAIIDSFCTERRNVKNTKSFIIQPKEFVFKDSVSGSMICKIKDCSKPNIINEATIDVIEKEGKWRISSSSDFFEIFQIKNEKNVKPKQEHTK
jgi:hypothetical protein